jgi:hypothetical protein
MIPFKILGLLTACFCRHILLHEKKEEQEKNDPSGEKMRTFIKKTGDHAVVGVVTAILLIGLIVAVISLVQTVYIPKIMEQREAEHMDKVAEQFTYLTSVIDGQAANQMKNMPVATSITLGSKELPYMLSIKAFGTLQILDNARVLNLTLENGSIKTFHIGEITYSSINGYFLDQSYTYQAGAMIVSQSEGNLMMIHPSFFVDYDSTQNTLNIIFDVVNISSIGQKTIASGFGTYPIQTEFSNISYDVTFTNVSTMTFTTPLSNAWFVFISQSLRAADPYLDNVLSDTGSSVRLDFSSLSKANVIVKIIDINAQIGPGWVEQP